MIYRRAALWLVRTACSRRHVEEIEGDLLELHRRHCMGTDRRRSQPSLLLEALRAVLARPSVGLRRMVLTPTLVGMVLIAYLAVVLQLPERTWTVWLVGLGVAVEALFWIVLFFETRDGAGQSS